jgi:beta-lactam-binding protein with PASTA domain
VPVEESPLSNIVVDVPPGTTPDVRGMSARDAMRKLVKAGLSAQLSGDGFVIAQIPAAGDPIDDGGVCRLTLGRATIRQAASAQ